MSEFRCRMVQPLFASIERPGWGARTRTWEWRNQNPLPYRLATPQHRCRRAARGGADHNGCAIGPQPAPASLISAPQGATQPPVSQLGTCRLMWRARPAYAARSIGGAARAETVVMRKALPATFVACLGVALVWAPTVGTAASFECAARFLSQARIAICRTPSCRVPTSRRHAGWQACRAGSLSASTWACGTGTAAGPSTATAAEPIAVA